MPKKVTSQDFIAKARAVHGDKYDYSKVSYVSAKSNVTILCAPHGAFEQIPNNHLGGKGCPECAKNSRWDGRRQTTEGFISLAKSVHGDRYDYSLTEYVDVRTKLKIICSVHGVFSQTPGDHTQGYGCAPCGIEAARVAKTRSNTQFIERAKEVHGSKYSYEKTRFVSYLYPVTITCPSHGDFTQTPPSHLQGHGCHLCGGSKKLTTKDFIKKAKAAHGKLYDYSKTNYINTDTSVVVTCKSHGDFDIIPYNHLMGRGCKLCSCWGPSKVEMEMSSFVAGFIRIVPSNRTLIAPQEIDCLVPSKKLGIEFCGTYYHSEKFLDAPYHLKKLQAVNAAGHELIQVFEDEWVENPHIVKSILKNKLGFTDTVIPARKTRVAVVTFSECKSFLDANHLQGGSLAPIRLGLYLGEELVMVAAFSSDRKVLGDMPDGWFELVRLCTKIDTVVVGGFSKLLKHFVSEHSPKGIKTFCDKRYFNGRGYEAVGFVKSHDSAPNYFYVMRNKRYSRYMFQKHKLAGKLEKFDPALSEKQNMLNNGYLRIYDCGNAVYLMDLS